MQPKTAPANVGVWQPECSRNSLLSVKDARLGEGARGRCALEGGSSFLLSR